LGIARVSRHDRHVNGHDRIAVVTYGITVDQHDRHRSMTATFKRLDKPPMRLEVHANPTAKMLIERDHVVPHVRSRHRRTPKKAMLARTRIPRECRESTVDPGARAKRKRVPGKPIDYVRAGTPHPARHVPIAEADPQAR
jgi:hypothetical protein